MDSFSFLRLLLCLRDSVNIESAWPRSSIASVNYFCCSREILGLNPWSDRLVFLSCGSFRIFRLRRIGVATFVHTVLFFCCCSREMLGLNPWSDGLVFLSCVYCVHMRFRSCRIGVATCFAGADGGHWLTVCLSCIIVIKYVVQYVESAVPCAPIDSFYVFYFISVCRRFRLRRLGVATFYHCQCEFLSFVLRRCYGWIRDSTDCFLSCVCCVHRRFR